MKVGRRFCWTLNNWTPEEEKNIRSAEYVYQIFGYETGETNKLPHLQGFTICKGAKSMIGFKKLLGCSRMHVENTYGTSKQAAEYCRKSGNYLEDGKLPGGERSRSDLTDIRDMICDTESENSFADIFDAIPSSIRYKKQIEELIKDRDFERTKEAILKEEFGENFKLYEWQKRVLDAVTNPDVKERKIIWIFEQTGGSGKSTFARYMECKYGAFRCENKRTMDVAHAYDMESIVIFDLARSQLDRINYEVIEALHNGHIFASKYESRSKLFKKPQVLVFANECFEKGHISDYKILLYHLVPDRGAPGGWQLITCNYDPEYDRDRNERSDDDSSPPSSPKVKPLKRVLRDLMEEKD